MPRSDPYSDLNEEQRERQRKRDEKFKREVYRRSQDRIRIANPHEREFNFLHDGFRHSMPAAGKDIGYGPGQIVMLRYLAKHASKHLIDFLINEENQYRVDAENKKRSDQGRPFMTPQERELFDLRTNNETLRDKWMAKIWLGIEEEYGIDEVPLEVPQARDVRTIDERLISKYDKPVQAVQVPTAQDQKDRQVLQDKPFPELKKMAKAMGIKSGIGERKEDLISRIAGA